MNGPYAAGAGAAQLSPAHRASALAAAGSDVHDIVVVGGGVTGAGVALDAATRGLSVVLLEAGDLAGGTSSRSGKTAHGGLRYLEQLNLALVAGALRERDLMMHRLAPHLVTAEPFLFPLTSPWQRAYVGAGIALYDAMATAGGWRSGDGGVPHHRHLSRQRALRESPGLRPDAVTGAVQYVDGRLDDARHTLAVARTASAYGAHVISRARVVEMRREHGRVTGVVAEDVGTGRTARGARPCRRQRGRGLGRAGAGDGGASDIRGAARQGRAPAVRCRGVRVPHRADRPGRRLGGRAAPLVRAVAARHHRHRLRRPAVPTGGRAR